MLIFLLLVAPILNDTGAQPWEGLFTEDHSFSAVPERLESILAAHLDHGVRTTFIETKKVSVMRRPLKSRGNLVFLPDHGLYREMTEPFPLELVVTTKGFSERDESGAITRFPLERQPVAQAFVEAFFAVFSGSWESLQQHFRVYFQSQDNNWSLGLVPKNQMMAKVIERMVVRGDNNDLKELFVLETNGDLTHDVFVDAQLIPREAWPEQAERYRWAH